MPGRGRGLGPRRHSERMRLPLLHLCMRTGATDRDPPHPFRIFSYLAKYQYSGRSVPSGLLPTLASLPLVASTVYALGIQMNGS